MQISTSSSGIASETTVKGHKEGLEAERKKGGHPVFVTRYFSEVISVKEKLKILRTVKERRGNLCLDKKSWKISGVWEVTYVTQGAKQKNSTHFQVAQGQWRELSQGPLVCVVKMGSEGLESSHKEDTGLSLIRKLGKCTWTVCRWSIIGNFLICFATTTPAMVCPCIGINSNGNLLQQRCSKRHKLKPKENNNLKIHSTNES